MRFSTATRRLRAAASGCASARFAQAPRLTELAQKDAAYRVRETALASLAQTKASGVLDTLEAQVSVDSPDDVIRRAALRAIGRLGDDKAAPLLLTWATQGKGIRVREAAIASLGMVDKKNKTIETQLIAYLDDPNFDIRSATIFALGDRADTAAIAPLEAMLSKSDLPTDFATVVRRQIDRLKRITPANTPSPAVSSAEPTA